MKVEQLRDVVNHLLSRCDQPGLDKVAHVVGTQQLLPDKQFAAMMREELAKQTDVVQHWWAEPCGPNCNHEGQLN